MRALTLYRRLERGPLTTVMNDFDEVFARALRNQGLQSTEANGDSVSPKEFFEPKIELDEFEHAFQLSFDLPGVKRENLKIDAQGRALTVKGERKRETIDKDGGVLVLSSVHFDKRFTLPDSVQTDRIGAQMENGVLRLLLPKAEAAKSRSIEIESHPLK